MELNPRIKNHAIKMLNVRGATIHLDQEYNSEGLATIVPFKQLAKGPGLLCFISRTLNIVVVKALGEEVAERKVKHVIVVHPGQATAQGARTLMTMEQAGLFRSECFQERFFQNDLLEHQLVPRHVRAERPESVRKKYGNGLPTIKTIDPICRYHDFRSGDIVKVIRRNGSIAFRRVDT